MSDSALDINTHGTLRKLGFEPGTTIFSSCPMFTLDELTASAFDTRHSSPATIPVAIDKHDIVQVAVTQVQLAFSVNELDENYAEKPTAYYERSDWHLEGWIVEEGSSYENQRHRVRAYVFSNGLEDEPFSLEEVIAQIIPAKG